MTDNIGRAPAAYVRRSTDKQDDAHQAQDVRDWLTARDVTVGDVEWYEDTASGARGDRDDFRNLLEDVQSGDVTDVVVWEISRIARKGSIAQEFFDAAEEAGVTIWITHGSVRAVRPDGTGRLVADIVASVAAEERRSLIRRTRSGIRQARDAGKWIGQTPAGFARGPDGYLSPVLDPQGEADEDGYLEVCSALEGVEAGESYRAAARGLNTTRKTLANIHQDDERKRWYLEGDADDERVAAALEDVTGRPDD